MPNKQKIYLNTAGEVISALKAGRNIYRDDLPNNIYFRLDEGFVCEHDAEMDCAVTEINARLSLDLFQYYIIGE